MARKEGIDYLVQRQQQEVNQSLEAEFGYEVMLKQKGGVDAAVLAIVVNSQVDRMKSDIKAKQSMEVGKSELAKGERLQESYNQLAKMYRGRGKNRIRDIKTRSLIKQRMDEIEKYLNG